MLILKSLLLGIKCVIDRQDFQIFFEIKQI